jgi:hypothetical protein
MVLNRKDHGRFHRREQNEESHGTHLTLAEQRAQGLKPVDPFALGGGFLAWCVQHGWLVHQGGKYFASKEGLRELRNQFEISL